MPRGFQKGPLWAFFHRSDTKPDGSIHFQATHWRCIEALRPKDEPSHVEGSLPLIENAHWFPEALANAIANELDVPGVKKYMIEHLRNCPHATPQEQTQGAEAQNKPAVSRNFRPVLDDEYRPIKRRRLQTDEILPANIDTHFPSTSASATSSFPVSSSESSSLSLSNSFSVSFSHVSQLSSSSNAALGAAGFGLALGLLPTTSSPANGFSSLSFARSIPTSRPVSSTEFTNATSGPLQLSGYTLLGSSFARPGPSSHLSSPTKHLSSINTFSSNSVQSDHQGRAQPNPQHRATLLPFVIHNSQEATSGALKENGKKRARKAQPPPSEFLRNAEGITSKEQAPPTKKMSSSCWSPPTSPEKPTKRQQRAVAGASERRPHHAWVSDSALSRVSLNEPVLDALTNGGLPRGRLTRVSCRNINKIHLLAEWMIGSVQKIPPNSRGLSHSVSRSVEIAYVYCNGSLRRNMYGIVPWEPLVDLVGGVVFEDCPDTGEKLLKDLEIVSDKFVCPMVVLINPGPLFRTKADELDATLLQRFDMAIGRLQSQKRTIAIFADSRDGPPNTYMSDAFNPCQLRLTYHTEHDTYVRC